MSEHSEESLTIAAQRRLVTRLGDLVAERVRSETAVPEEFSQRDAALNEQFESRRRALIEQHRSEQQRLEDEYAKANDDVEHEYDTDNYDIATEQQKVIDRATARYNKDYADAKDARKRVQREAVRKFEADRKEPLAEFARQKNIAVQQRQALGLLNSEAESILIARRIPIPSLPEPDGAAQDKEGPLEFAPAVEACQRLIHRMENQFSTRFIYEHWPLFIFAFGVMTVPVALGFTMGWSNWPIWLGGGLGGPLALSLSLYGLVIPWARNSTLRMLADIRKTIARADALIAAQLDAVKAQCEPRFQAAQAVRDDVVGAAQAEWDAASARITAERDAQLVSAKEKYQGRHTEISDRRKRKLAEAEAHYPPLIAERKAAHKVALEELSQEHQRALDASRETFEADWNAMRSQWVDGVHNVAAELDAMNAYCAERFPAWETVNWDAWRPPADAPPAVQFGRQAVTLADFPDGVSAYDDLAVEPTRFAPPAWITFPERPSLLLEAEGEARDAAIRVMQNVMLRLLASLPPGKVRFTIIDPTGRGQNFSAFMHLADFDDQLVTSRIWTESAHINKRLMDITEHMENVIQKYLRNEFEAIQQYNKEAGEVAEPYRVLVVANYPTNFSDEAARRLMSIVASGARCGVSTLISVDTKEAAARKMDLTDLRAHSATLEFNDEGARLVDEQLG
ncbi:MAG: hypothetical protein KDA41_10700, partial [Planctomycetales bacterium]|nr:hypothetical protein [Planctomycetales bacterium]